MGKRAWLFSWTEVGAQHVGIIQSLIVTCRLHESIPKTIWWMCCSEWETIPPAPCFGMTGHDTGIGGHVGPEYPAFLLVSRTADALS